jgi:hypothetical protein
MVNIVVKPGNTEITLTTANTVYGSQAVRLVNIGANASLITVAQGANSATANGTFTLRANSEVVVKKTPVDTVAANTNSVVLATPVGFF